MNCQVYSWKGFSDHCLIAADVVIHSFDVMVETEAAL
jgi:hypothetical protein